MKTKAYIRFLNAIANYDCDIELMDILKKYTRNDEILKAVFASANSRQHPKFTCLRSSQSEMSKRMNHLENVLYDSMIKIYYESVIAYLHDILSEAMLQPVDAVTLVGSENEKFTSIDILKMGSFEEIRRRLAATIFRKIENKRNTLLLLTELNQRLGLKVDDNVMNKALPYLEMRHLIVHNNSIADEVFCNAYPEFRFHVNQEIEINYRFIRRAKDTICTMIKQFDEKIVELNIVRESFLQP